MRFVHLAPDSSARSIKRSGLTGTKAALAAASGQEVILANAVYAMPVVPDMWTTFQWVREIRRYHDARLVAVYFRWPDQEQVYVGRYNQPHIQMSAAAAARWVTSNPLGAQVVVPVGIAAKHILGIRDVPQLIGWTQNPNAEKRTGCVCPACLWQGDRAFMRRVRAAFQAGIVAVRGAQTDKATIDLLGNLEMPLERANGRIAPKPLLAFAKSKNPEIRAAIASLLGMFKAVQVESTLQRLVHDDVPAVSKASVEALERVAGMTRTMSLLDKTTPDTIAHFIELAAYEPKEATAFKVLDYFASHESVAVTAAVARVATSLLEDFKGCEVTRQRLEAFVTQVAS